MGSTKHQKFIDAFRHAALDCASSGMQILARDDFPSNEYIHQVRVYTKRLRAFLRAVRPLMADEKLFRLHDHQLRDAARLLSVSRENSVNRKLLSKFMISVDKGKEREKDKQKERIAIQTFIDLIPDSSDDNLHIQKDKVETCFAGQYAAWGDGLFSNTPHDVRTRLGFADTYTRAKKLGRLAIDLKMEPETTHKWRKWTKYLYFQVEVMLQVMNDKKLKKYLKYLESLGQVMGKYHDLFILRETMEGLERRVVPDIDSSRIYQLIERRNHRLRKQLKENYNQCFDKGSCQLITQ